MRRGIALVVLLVLSALSCDSKSTAPQSDPRDRDFMPAWSPDGGSIVYLHQESDGPYEVAEFLRVIDAGTGALKRQLLVEGNFPLPWDMSWTPDGRWLLFTSGAGIFKLSSNLDTLIQLTSGWPHNGPSWSGSKNLIFFYSPFVAEGGLLSTTLEGDSIHRWSTTETLVSATTCYPGDADSLVGWTYVHGSARMLFFDPDDIAGGDLQSWIVVTPYKTRMSSTYRHVAYNAVGHGDYGHENLYLLDRLTGNTELISRDTEAMDFSPDGKKLVYPKLYGGVGLWIVDVATLEQTRLTFRQN